MRRTTSIVLGEHFGPFVEQLVQSGRYGNVSDVVRAGLRQLQVAEARQARLERFLASCPEEELTEEEEAQIEAARAETELVSGEELRAELFPDEFDAPAAER